MTESHEPSTLRTSVFGGYRKGDVDVSVARSTVAVEQLTTELEATRARANAMQSEINELHARIDAFRGRELELDREMAQLRDQRAQAEREAKARADAIVVEAEKKAAALRTEGLREVGQLQQQVEQLLGMRAGLTQALQAAADNIDAALAHARSAPGRSLERSPAS